jgi:flagellar biosynthesis chaperone FliJ
MRARNPLRRLLRLREIREDQARAALAGASQASRAAGELLDARTDEHNGRPGLPEILSPAELRGLMLQGVRSHEVMAAAADAYDRALGQTDVARRGWSAASSELRSAEKLDLRRRRESERTAQAAAERALDELVLTLRNLRRWI